MSQYINRKLTQRVVQFGTVNKVAARITRTSQHPRTKLQELKAYGNQIAMVAGLTGFWTYVIASRWYGNKWTTSFYCKDMNISPIIADIEDYLEDNEEMGPTLVRLAWHASGTYSKVDGSGGCDGARMRYSPEKDWGANAGLDTARDEMAEIAKKNPGISIADLWILAGTVAIRKMQGPDIPIRLGRIDEPNGKKSPPDGRLPDADKGKIGDTIKHVRAIFGRMGFNDQEIVALLGAHALGFCHTGNSGYTGPWTDEPFVFGNKYYKNLLEKTWTLKKWDGPDQFEDQDKTIMMLPADMALVWDKDFRRHVVAYADNKELFFKDFSAAWIKLTELGCKLN